MFAKVAAIKETPDIDLMTGCLDMNDKPKLETAYTSHHLTPEQHSKLRKVIETCPSSLEKG